MQLDICTCSCEPSLIPTRRARRTPRFQVSNQIFCEGFLFLFFASRLWTAQVPPHLDHTTLSSGRDI
eukprot:11228929-Prorocentrum_lima.AAC.1